MSDVNQLKKALKGLAEGYDTDATPTLAEGDPVDQLTDIVVQKDVAADGAAGTAIAQTNLFTNCFNFNLLVVRAVVVTSAAAVTPDAANYGTMTLQRDDGLNGAPVTIGSVTSQTGQTNPIGTTADVATDFPLTLANCVIPPGGNLMLVQTKTGTGVQFPARAITVRMRRAA
jgi:hypothetical protein